jgi:phage shock protein E
MFGLFQKMMGGTSNPELKQHIQDGAMLVDVRTPGEFSSGSAKGAVNIPLDQLPKSLNKLKGKNHIIVFCRSGNRSSQAEAFLKQQGITEVSNGGTWQQVAALVE